MNNEKWLPVNNFSHKPKAYQSCVFFTKKESKFRCQKTLNFDKLLNQTTKWQQHSDNHHIITINSPLYPKLLKQISDLPLILFAIGNTDLLSKTQISIVGTRNCSSYANEALNFLIPSLIQTNLTIVTTLFYSKTANIR